MLTPTSGRDVNASRTTPCTSRVPAWASTGEADAATNAPITPRSRIARRVGGKCCCKRSVTRAMSDTWFRDVCSRRFSHERSVTDAVLASANHPRHPRQCLFDCSNSTEGVSTRVGIHSRLSAPRVGTLGAIRNFHRRHSRDRSPTRAAGRSTAASGVSCRSRYTRNPPSSRATLCVRAASSA
jgi:hypothetical protein